jgi:hypothetical protein
MGLHCCSVCGGSLFFCGYPESGMCSLCSSHRRKHGQDPPDAASRKARTEREEAKADEIRRRTMKFRDGRRGTDGIPGPDDWNY